MAIVCGRSGSGTTSWSSSCSSSTRPLLAILRSVLTHRCCSSSLFDSSSVCASSSTVSSSVSTSSSSASRAAVKSSDRVEDEASSFNLRFSRGRDQVNSGVLESRDARGTVTNCGEREAGKVEEGENVAPSTLRPWIRQARSKSEKGYLVANPFEAIAGQGSTFMEVSRLCSTLLYGPQRTSSYPCFGKNTPRPAPIDQAQQLRFTSSSSHKRLPASPDLSVGTSVEEKLDPFALVADELALLGHKLRSMVAAEIPTLAEAAEYFFKLGVEGKRFRPMVLLLMASSLTEDTGLNSLAAGQRVRQQRIAEITEMIHVASLLHDDVLDHADTRRGISSLNHVMGNKLAVLAGDFLLSRASVALASLHNIEVVELLSKVLEHLVTGEIMQLTTETQEICSMEYYMQKTFYKTASLMANSCKAIAILADQPREVADLAFEYGRHLGLAFQLVDDSLDFVGTKASLGKPTLSDLAQGIATAPVLFALEEHPRIYDLVKRKFRRSGDVDQALEMVRNSDGIFKTQQLAANHAHQAALAVASLPPSSSEKVQLCRRALTELTQQVITRSK